MKTFKDYTGEEGIDKVIECAPFINEIITDKDVMENLDKMSFLEMGATIVKNHGKAFKEVRKALGNEDTDSIGLSYSAAQLMKELLTNKDILDFFTSFANTQT